MPDATDSGCIIGPLAGNAAAVRTSPCDQRVCHPGRLLTAAAELAKTAKQSPSFQHQELLEEQELWLLRNLLLSYGIMML